MTPVGWSSQLSTTVSFRGVQAPKRYLPDQGLRSLQRRTHRGAVSHELAHRQRFSAVTARTTCRCARPLSTAVTARTTCRCARPLIVHFQETAAPC